MSSFDGYVGGFTDYVKQLLSQNPEVFGMAPAAPVYVYDPVLGRVVQKTPTATSTPTPGIWQTGTPNTPTMQPPPMPAATPMTPSARSAANAFTPTVYANQQGQMPANLWRETGATRSAYQQSANLYSGYGGQMGEFAKRLMGQIQDWNNTYNSGPGTVQVRAFAPNPMGYDAQGSMVLRDESGQNIYADETDKISAALKRLQQPVASNAPTYQPATPNIYGGAGVW